MLSRDKISTDDSSIDRNWIYEYATRVISLNNYHWIHYINIFVAYKSSIDFNITKVEFVLDYNITKRI